MGATVLLAGVGLLAVALLVTWLVVWIPSARRDHALRAVAAGYPGLAMSAGSGGEPLPRARLFRRGSDREVPRTLHGELAGRPVRVLDLVYTRETPSVSHWWDELWFVAEAVRRWSHLATRRTLTCAVVELPGTDWPELIVDARGRAASRDAQHLTSRTLRTESDEFNQAFDVHCDDPRFASHVLDARMMRFLLSMGRDVDLIVAGQHLVVVSASLPPSRWLDLQHLADLAAERVPDVAFSVFGGTRPAGSAAPTDGVT